MKKIVWALFAIILIFVAAFAVRYATYKEVGITLDEPFYVRGGLSYVSAALNLSFSSSAWDFNTEHPPVSKYIYGIASYILNGGQYDYNAFLIAKTMSIICGAVTCVLVYLIGRKFFNEYVGLLAGLILAFTPMMIAHNQLSNIDSPVTMMIAATMFVYMSAVQSESLKLYLLSALMLGLSIATKYNTLLIIPVMIGLYLLFRYHQSGGSLSKAVRDIASKPPKLLIVAICAAIVVLTVYAVWPYLWHDPLSNFEYSLSHWTNSGTLPETLLGASLTGGVPLYYYPLYFLVTTPEIMLLALAIGMFYLLKSRDAFKESMALWLFLPFVYGLSGFVMGSMRYILMIYPALALICAYGVYSLSMQAGGYLKKLKDYNDAPAVISLALGAIVVVSLIFTCLYAQPYYLDYYNSLSGGYQNIQDNKLFLLSWWGETVYDPVQYVETHANGAYVTVMASGIIGTNGYLGEYAKNNTYMTGGMGGFMPPGNQSMNRSLNMSGGPAGFPRPGEINMSFGMGGPQSGGGLLDILGSLMGLTNDRSMGMSFGPPDGANATMRGPGQPDRDNMTAAGPGWPGPISDGNMSADMQPPGGGFDMFGGMGMSSADNVTADYIIVGADASEPADYNREDYTLVYESTFHGVPLYDVYKLTS